jgi:hypothetical protein
MRRLLIGIVVLVVAVGASVANGAGSAVTELYADLTGDAETPPGAPNGTGTVEVKLNPANGRVCWEFTGLSGLQGKALAAHIHKGKVGKTGDIVVPFTDGFKREGCVTATKKVVKAILKSPGGYYVNVHTMKYPAGVVRGQLETSDD